MENTALIGIEIISKFYGVPIDIESVRKRYFIEEEPSIPEVLRILKDHGFKAKYKKFKSLQEIQKYPFPMIIVFKNNLYSVLLGVKDDKILYFDCLEKKPVQTKLEEFLKLWEYEAIVLYPNLNKLNFILILSGFLMNFLNIKVLSLK
jgi:ABC-type bacteriocin/lantibiotic exporter with double-glycine peptidase domain